MATEKKEETKKPLYEVIKGKEARLIMAKGGPYNLKEPQSQKALKFLYELGLTQYIKKNG